jgi:hypothetical protein
MNSISNGASFELRRILQSVQPAAAPAPVHGYRVTFERCNPRHGRPERVVFGCKHQQQSVAQGNARIKAGFLRVLSAEPLTAAQFAQEFPPGRSSKGRYVLHRA